jgi:putative ABC transport system permease protein
MMKYLRYMLRNVTRNRLRSLLTILSVCISLAMMTVLWGYLAMQDVWGMEAMKYRRVVMMNIQGFSGQVPYAHMERVRAMSAVQAAVPYSWFGGIYKDEKMPFAQFGTDPKEVFKVWDEFKIDPEQLKEWQSTRNGCVVDRRTAERRGWKIGEHVPLKGTYYDYDLDLIVCGIYDSPTPTDSLWFNWHYLDEGLQQRGSRVHGNCGTVFIKAAEGQSLPEICKSIDRIFESSDNPTRTQTEAEFAQMFAQMLGNLKFYITVIGCAVIFSLTLVAATAMAMSMRERTTEIAVLKAIGFQRYRVLFLFLGESCVIALIGGLVGVAAGSGLIQMAYVAAPQFFPVDIKTLAGPWMAYGVVAAGFIGIASGLIPALMAARLSVIDGLRRVV